MTRVAVFLLLWLAAGRLVLAAPPEVKKPAHAPRNARLADRAEWEIEFADDITAEEYARQLDFFQIEIAAVSKKGKLEYIAQVSSPKPEKRVGAQDADRRLHIGWRKGTLHAADRKLLAKAGITSEGKELWHFFSAELQAQLAELEHDYAGLSPDDIHRTRFLVREKTKGQGYEFVVIEQDPPQPTKPHPRPSKPAQRKLPDVKPAG